MANVPKFLRNNPEALKQWNEYILKIKQTSSGQYADRTFDPGPNIPIFDAQATGWSANASEWSAQPVTGISTTFENDTAFLLIVSGMRIIAELQFIIVTDASIPLQRPAYQQGFSELSTSYTFQFACSYFGKNNSFLVSKVISSILEVDSENTAVKTRIDFYKIYESASVIAVQLMIENRDMQTYIETKIRWNLSNDEITANLGQEVPFIETKNVSQSETYDYDLHIDLFNKSQAFLPINNTAFRQVISRENAGGLNFKGWTFYRRVPKIALRLSNFFPDIIAPTAPTIVATNEKTYVSLNMFAWVTFALVLMFIAVILYENSKPVKKLLSALETQASLFPQVSTIIPSIESFGNV